MHVNRQVLDGEARVQFLNMNDAWTRWLPLDSGQLAPPAAKVGAARPHQPNMGALTTCGT